MVGITRPSVAGSSYNDRVTGYTFAAQNQMGQEGERLFRRHLDTLPVAYQDVSGDRAYQQRGIDLVVRPLEGAEYTVDVKSDGYDTGNVALELLLSDDQGERPGCAVSGEAD